MEIWIAEGTKKELKKAHPFLRDFGVIDVKEIVTLLGYKSSLDLDDYSSFILNNEIKKKLEAFNNSKRFYRILFLVENANEELAHNLLDFSVNLNLKYEAIYIRENSEFKLVCKSY